MNRQVRFVAWVLAVVGAMVCEMTGGTFAWIGTVFLASVVALLATTPIDAVRLRSWVSIWLITVATAVLQSAAVHRGQNSVFVAASVVVLSLIFSIWFAQLHRSPWWTIPLMWGPWSSLGWVGIASIALTTVCVISVLPDAA